ncbi:hypothetical protein [Plantactinospora sp. KBS50]|uniref:hypothetical protein n=1 Tax=Plantactinospora sp. KBS50 TaxID=2024580 RepID=UPI0012FE6821|nr:hypothetical protein [Plantactinospora sp. KBS50]
MRTPRPLVVAILVAALVMAGVGVAAASESGTPDASVSGAAVLTYPTEATTGVPAGTTLRASGPLTVGTAGQVISGLDIAGCVTVAANNVTIRQSRIRCGGNYSVRTMPGVQNLLVEDVEIDGLGTNNAAVCCAGYTLRRVDISNVIDGPRLGDDTVVEDSWIHHLNRTASSHNDALQTTGAVNVVVRRNRLEAYNPVTKDPMNACIMIGSTTGPIVADLIFRDNYCTGGNYSIGVRVDLVARNIQFVGNTFGHDCRYGVINHPDQVGVLWDRPTNLWLDTQAAVVR